MYEIIETPKRMTKKEIFSTFDGKWVFLVDLDGEIFKPWYSAIPVVVADKAWAGKETGMYDEYRSKHERRMHLSLLDNEINVFGFSELVQKDV
ncbi:MAG: hypothetical protein FWB88_12790 [Defluviitaleaceae bacterium]|nr:hypothetical protein [Defluviitaleaceae bacterium]MCL2240646.1 hypothetical protein [Defluviitaleaceae bacterium]